MVTGDDGVHAADGGGNGTREARIQARYSQLTFAQLGGFDWDISNGTIVWNDELYRIAGLDPTRYSPTIESFAEIVHPDDRAGFGDMVEELFRTKRTSQIEFRLYRPDGSLRYLQSRGYVVLGPEGELQRFIGTVLDATDHMATERAKDEFVSAVSHELRTPLTSIRGALGLLTSGVLGQIPSVEGRRMLDVALASTDRLIRLVNGILDMERLTSGRVALALQPSDMATLLAQAVQELRGAADVAGVTLHLEHVEGRVLADPDRVIQTLANLIGNAIKFSPDGATVRIRSDLVNGPGSVEAGVPTAEVGQAPGDAPAFGAMGPMVMVSVADDGPGIPADQLERVFERFQQVDSSDTRAKGGTGLGLAISRSIVEQHGGRIWGVSPPNSGATFSFTLPALDEPPSSASDEAGWGAGRRRVLLCDDDPAVREVVGTLLRSSGFDVMVTGEGSEALALARQHRPDIIVLDLLMPGIDGRDTAVALKHDPATADIPIVVLSVLTAEELPVGEAAARVGKPIEGDTLVVALHRALNTGRPRVLIVEDDEGLAAVLSAMLSRHGFEPLHARSGSEAVRVSRTAAPDLLVLDLAVPQGDGYSIVEALRHEGRLASVPLLVYTAFDLDDSDRDRLRLGETYFLTKGHISTDALERQINLLLEHITRDRPATPGRNVP